MEKTNYKHLTAPCGRDCFNCPLYLAQKDERLKHYFAEKYGMAPEEVPCAGCRDIEGNCNLFKALGFGGKCTIYSCVEEKGVEFCGDCDDFPCTKLQPMADKAATFPHNLKVYNLCRIQKIGVERWAVEESKAIWDRYYNEKLEL